jgi:3-dehydroquinate dehydratase-2
VHMTNPARREEFRHTSVVAGVADGTVAGFGLMSYQLALQAIAELTAVEAAAGQGTVSADTVSADTVSAEAGPAPAEG